MMDVSMLTYIHYRCREIFPLSSDQPFGGLNIVLAGDFYQLPPVLGTAMFSTQKAKTVYAATGQQLYKLFNKTIELTELMRQGPNEAPFRRALEELRNGKVSMQSWQLLLSRVRSTLTIAEQQTFKDAVQLVLTRKEFYERNYERLRDRGVAVINSVASHQGSGAVKAKDDVAGNLMAVLLLSIGAMYMVTESLWTEAGIVNGTRVTLMDLMWYSGRDTSRDPLDCALV
jgi:ATP-dependent DNA helicase PIF1